MAEEGCKEEFHQDAPLASSTPLLLVANEDYDDGGGDATDRCDGCEKNNEGNDKHKKRELQREARIRLIRYYIGILSVCFLLILAAVAITGFARLPPGNVVHVPSLLADLTYECGVDNFFSGTPSFDVLQSLEDYESFQKKHNNTFVMFHRRFEPICSILIDDWNAVGLTARTLFPGLGVGAMLVDASDLRHIAANISSLPSFVIHGEAKNTSGAISPLHGYPELYLGFYNRTSLSIPSFHDLYYDITDPKFVSLNSLDDFNACVSRDPTALVLAYRPSSLFPAGWDDREHVELLFRSWNYLADRVSDASPGRPTCVGVVDLTVNPAVASKLRIKDSIALFENDPDSGLLGGSYHGNNGEHLVTCLVRDINDKLWWNTIVNRIQKINNTTNH